MSAIFIVIPIMIAYPFFIGGAGAAAAALGFEVAKRTAKELADTQETERVQEMEIEQTEVLSEMMAQEDAIEMTRGEVTVRLYAAPGVKGCRMRVSGPKEMTSEDLSEIGQQVLSKVTQQYAYHKVVSELGKKGYKVVKEVNEEDGSIKLTVRKWEE